MYRITSVRMACQVAVRNYLLTNFGRSYKLVLMNKKLLKPLLMVGFFVAMIFFTAWAARREQDIRSQAAPLRFAKPTTSPVKPNNSLIRPNYGNPKQTGPTPRSAY